MYSLGTVLRRSCLFRAPFIAGHDLIELSYRFKLPPIPTRTISRWSYRGFSDTAYRDVLERALDADCLFEPGEVLTTERVDCLLNSFQNAIISALDDQAPLRSFRVRRPGAPWLSVVSRSRIRERNALYRQARRSGSVLAWAEYRRFRDVLVADLRRAQSDHCLERLRGVTDVAKLWRELASLGLVRPSGSSPLSFFTADQLNSFFVTVSFASTVCSITDLTTALDIPLPSHPIFEFSAVSPESVSRVILSATSSSRATGPDGISLFSIHHALPRVASLLALLFNACLRLGHFPSSWKRAFVRPLLKVNPPTSPSDTRPIANLCELSKIFERVVHRQITDFIVANEVLDSRQSGFRCGYSTQSALLRVCHDVRRAVDLGRVTILVLFDFSKAFDTVCHSRLLTKLLALGFSDMHFLGSSLTLRAEPSL